MTPQRETMLLQCKYKKKNSGDKLQSHGWNPQISPLGCWVCSLATNKLMTRLGELAGDATWTEIHNISRVHKPSTTVASPELHYLLLISIGTSLWLLLPLSLRVDWNPCGVTFKYEMLLQLCLNKHITLHSWHFHCLPLSSSLSILRSSDFTLSVTIKGQNDLNFLYFYLTFFPISIVSS